MTADNRPPEEWGPEKWDELDVWAKSIPCPGCRAEAIQFRHAFQDYVNIKRGLAPHYPNELAYMAMSLTNANATCARHGTCPAKYSCRVGEGCKPK